VECVSGKKERRKESVLVTSNLVESHTPAGSIPVLTDSSWAGTFPRCSRSRAYESMETLGELSLFDLFHCSSQQKRLNKESTERTLTIILTTISDSGAHHCAVKLCQSCQQLCNRTADLQRRGIAVRSPMTFEVQKHRAIGHWIDGHSEEKRKTTWKEISDQPGSPVLTENTP